VLLPAPGESAAPSGTGQAGAQGIAPPRRRLLAGLILARLSDA